MATATAALQRVRGSSLIDADRPRPARARRHLARSSSSSRIRRGSSTSSIIGAHERRDLRPRRARLHARLRHPPADQLRPRRRLRALGPRREHDDHLGLRPGRRHRRRSLIIVGLARDARRHDAALRALQRDDRADRLQAATKRAAARAADHGGRHVVHRPEHLARRSTASTSSRFRTSFRARTRSRSAASRSSGTTSRVFLIVVPVLLVLTWFVRSTRQGKAMRAVAQDTEASAMMGIDVNRTISVTFFLAGCACRGCRARLPPPVQHPLRHRLPARADRVHGGGARRHRQPHGRRPRRADDRLRSRPSTRASTELPAATGRARSCSGS